MENVNSNLSSRVTSLFQDVTALSSSLSDVTEHVTSLESSLSSPRDSVPAASDVTGGLLKKVNLFLLLFFDFLGGFVIQMFFFLSKTQVT